MMNKPSGQRLRSFLLAGCILGLAAGLIPFHVVHADTFNSDLAIRLLSSPRHAKACHVFEVTFEIANLGPDRARGIVIDDTAPDQLGVIDIQGVPATLAPGESRQGWIGASIYSYPYPDTSLDPNLENNQAVQPLKFIGRRQSGCP